MAMDLATDSAGGCNGWMKLRLSILAVYQGIEVVVCQERSRLSWIEGRVCDRVALLRSADRVARRALAKLGGSKSADRVWVRLKGENV
jgi:hypothetical protein